MSARDEWTRASAVEAFRARLAMIALGVTAVFHALMLVASASAAGLGMLELFALAELVLLVTTATLFLRWLSFAVSTASSMSALRLKWTSSAAVWSFFMPVVGLWRPYQVVRDLHDLLAPSAVPEPAPKPVLDGSGGYRNVEMRAAPPPRALPHASIGAWWGLFIATRVMGYGEMHAQQSFALLGDFLSIASALLGLFVVRAIDGRLQERFRRLNHASDEELAALHLRV